jgi:hypothetical protein
MVNRNSYHDDPYAKEFGIKISERLALVEARVLPAPRVSGTSIMLRQCLLKLFILWPWPLSASAPLVVT